MVVRGLGPGFVLLWGVMKRGVGWQGDLGRVKGTEVGD